jgi:hypothetical protein
MAVGFATVAGTAVVRVGLRYDTGLITKFGRQ